ncbi:MAG: F0F1 ATP synthase subunit epsilon [Chitinivibrionales bacterium]|nr:F0F1 ATP synthase subunit epsilon [Chitinivibrionales bacterium]
MANEKTYLLEIVTPQKKIFSQQVQFAVFPALEGEIGVLPHHTAFLSPLACGKVKITDAEGKNSYCAVCGGFVEVGKNSVSLLAELAEFASEIDVERAKKSKTDAESLLAQAQSPAEKAAARLKHNKAITRIAVAKQAALSKIE